MRMRKKKNLEPRFEMCGEILIKQPEEYRGRFCELFSRTAPLYLEIGAGKGAFSRKMCGKEGRDFNYIALEKVREALIIAMEKAIADDIKDIRFISTDAMLISEVFGDGEIDKIFLNFSDPWPKSRNAKRRLTHEIFLNQYKKVLKPEGEIIFKTDNPRLFEFSLGEFSKCGFLLQDITLDLHNSKYADENLTTEYEDRFVSQGLPIYRVVAVNKA